MHGCCFFLNHSVCKQRLVQHSYRQSKCWFFKWPPYGPSGIQPKSPLARLYLHSIVQPLHWNSFQILTFSRLPWFFHVFHTECVWSYCTATTFGTPRLLVRTVTPLFFFPKSLVPLGWHLQNLILDSPLNQFLYLQLYTLYMEYYLGFK